jgi:hypothetical protein
MWPDVLFTSRDCRKPRVFNGFIGVISRANDDDVRGVRAVKRGRRCGCSRVRRGDFSEGGRLEQPLLGEFCEFRLSVEGGGRLAGSRNAVTFILAGGPPMTGFDSSFFHVTPPSSVQAKFWVSVPGV